MDAPSPGIHGKGGTPVASPVHDSHKSSNDHHQPDNPPVAIAGRIVPLLWGKREIRAAIGVSEATFDRLLSSGRFPRPDVRIGRMPKWRPATVHEWIDIESRRPGRR